MHKRMSPHGDADHLGDALNIIENIEVKNVILNRGKFNYNEQQIINSSVNIIKDYNGILDMDILWTDIEDDENSNSLILSLKIRNEDFLLMGDATKEKEKEILSKYRIRDIDTIKLGHHGSKTSSDNEFLKSINPEFAIISCGRNNKFGHPHQEVLDTLDKITTYRTDLDGSIRFEIKNNKLEIETCSP